MISYTSMLNEIRARPEELLGDASCERMQAFLHGWIAGIHTYASPGTKYDWPNREFGIALFAKYELPYTVFNEFSLVQLFSANDRDAFHLFFKEWDSFIAKKSDCLVPAYTGSKSFLPKLRKTCLLKLLVDLRLKPPLILGVKSVTLLRAFLDGETYAFKQLRPRKKLDPDWDEFEVWLMKKEKVRRRCRWERLSLTYNFQDEARALDWFFERFDIWMARRKK